MPHKNINYQMLLIKTTIT